jgi:hypothetical protein
MKVNKHVQAMPQDILTQAQTKINGVQDAFGSLCGSPAPFGMARTAENGRETVNFVEKAYDFAQ